MLEIKDPAIKLFGKEIPFPAISDESGQLMEKEKSGRNWGSEEKTEKDSSTDNSTTATALQDTEESPDPQTSPRNKNTVMSNPEKSKSIDDENNPKPQKEQNETSNPQDQTKQLKKPDKILPCPRCNSMDTKFCYYNNYNIHQPRHFCKACQRYWTAGGTMRNVPVGAGRRKNKSSSSHYRNITISEALQAARIDAPNGLNQPGLKTNGRVLSFGLEAQRRSVCDSMVSVLKLGDQKVLNGTTINGFHGFGEQRVLVPCRGMENGEDCSSGSSATVSNNNSKDELRGRNFRVQETPIMKNLNGFTPSPVPCVPGVPWPYPWNPGFFPPPGFPMPFYPYWSVPVLSPQSPSSSQKGSNSLGSNSPTLGKHSREEDDVKKDGSEKLDKSSSKQKTSCVLVPKTLRIDDPNEAAKSSIWATLGIKNEWISKGGMFKGFDQKDKEKKKNSQAVETSPVLCANPAALSRSLDFHELT